VSSAGDLQEIERQAVAAIAAAATPDDIEAARVAHTGRKSPLAEALAGIGSLPPEQRGEVGKAGNTARKAIESALEERTTAIQAQALASRLDEERVDITLPGDRRDVGALHPIMQVRREIEDIFLGMGYAIADGPEVETDHHNFTALNTPEGHPARSMSDTLYIEGGHKTALRPQTSPVQVRAMEAQEPPIYLIAPGTVYRRDDVDATHSPMFHQLEGLAIDEGLGMADLIGTLQHFITEFFGESLESRIQPHFFPFTEPSIEVHVRWTDKRGRATWLELLGAGVVDPNVIEGAGYDSERWTGFAFGLGLDRIAMVRHGVPDLRLMYESDLRFLGQFS
jgi:phenylalanyl-tRNA synthetase alpha chain